MQDVIDKRINFVLDVVYNYNINKMFKAYASSESLENNEEEKKPIVTSNNGK